MSSATVYAVFGRPSNDAAVVQAFRTIGVDLDAELELPDGEFIAYVERPRDGIAFSFSDEGYFIGPGDMPFGEGRLFFTGVIFYVQEVDEYWPCESELPLGIRAGDAASDLSARLGTSEWQRRDDDGLLAAERWIVSGGRSLHVTYTRAGGILVVSYGLRSKAL
jgi:hypothetical protein